MTFKTILVHCDAGRSLQARLEAAISLAERSKAHLVGLHARPPFEPPAFSETGYPIAVLYEDHQAAVKAGEATASQAFATAVKGREISTEWRAVDGRPNDVLSVHARYADLVIVGQNDPDAPRTLVPPNLPETVALAASRPTLVIPYAGTAKSIGNNIMLCWNASREAARAASEALPLIKAAGAVTVLIVEPRITEKGHGAVPGADVATWLTRHGIKVNVQNEAAADGDVGGIILSRAMDLGTDLIVMGVYGHSRLREMVLGGASRTLLADMTVPVLMAH